MKRAFLKLFIILGPLGNLLTPQLISHSFRTYYLILWAFPVFYFPLIAKSVKILIFSVPFFLYCFVSSLIGSEDLSEEMPLFRFSLLLCQSLFAIGASYFVKDEDEMAGLIFLYCKSFFVSLFIGYIFYVGYYSNIFTLEVLDHFSVLTQIGYGFLRFSPGSYPNEYGIVCSFVLSILTWVWLDYENLKNTFKLSKRAVLMLYMLIAGALLLTTTRAAYLSYGFALSYLAGKKGFLGRIFILSFALFSGVSLLLALCGINIFTVFSVGFTLDNFESGSLADRFSIWKRAFELFAEEPLLGRGFSSLTYLHNLYFQILFELGVVGLGVLLGVMVLHFFQRRHFLFRSKGSESALARVAAVAAIHVLWFALSNHNMNHHLTWFTVFLCFSVANLRSKIPPIFPLRKLETPF